MSSERSRFVYMYLSTAGGHDVPVYVGRGTAERVESHGTDDLNAELAAVIGSGEYSVEVLDCGDPATAVVVEGALISAMRGRSKVDLKNRRLDQFNFSPLGVPAALASRRGEPALSPAEIARHVGGDVLFVRIGSKNLNDPDRAIIDPGNPSWEAVADRLRRWWYIAPWVDLWKRAPAKAPKVLIGVAGKKHRYVLGALDLSVVDWSDLEWDGKAVSFPISDEQKALDGFELRGRTVREGAIFGRASWEFAKVYDEDGPVARPTA